MIGGYDLGPKVADGGLTEVFAARQHGTDRDVAIAIVRLEARWHPTMVGAYLDAHRGLARIRHPGLVEVLEVGEHEDGRPFVVMELLSGRTAWNLPMRFDVVEAVRLGRALAAALGAAHAAGVIHAHLHPGNVMLDDRGAPTILGFGNARPHGEGLMGNPLYTAPELLTAPATADHRVDLYGVGQILFEVTCGRAPFAHAVGLEILTEPPPRPRAIVPALAPRFDALVMQLLEKDPARRPRDMAALAAALDAFTF